MKDLFLTIVLFISTYSIAQQKQYFDKDWEETTKEMALYYRTTTKTSSNLYQIEDYYIDGTIQMKGLSSDKDDKFEGKVSWYDKDGNLTVSREYVRGKLNGKSIQYSTVGDVISTGIYNNDKPIKGVFREYTDFSNRPSYIPDYNEQRISYLEYENGHEVSTLYYYKDTDKIAQKEQKINDGENRKERIFFDKKGTEIGHVFFGNTSSWKKNGIMILFYIENYQIIAVKQKREYVNDIITGKETTYKKDASVWFIGTYKKGEKYHGSFLNEYQVCFTYNNGVLTKKTYYDQSYDKIIGELTFKDTEPYNGIAIGYKKTTTYKDGQIKNIKLYFDEEMTFLQCDEIRKNDLEQEKKWYTEKGELLGIGHYEYSILNGLDINEEYTLFTHYKNQLRHGIEMQYSKIDPDFLIRKTLYNNDVVVWTETTHLLQKDKRLRLYYKEGQPFEGEKFVKNHNGYEHNYYNNGYVTKQIHYNDNYISDSGYLKIDKYYQIVDYTISDDQLGKCFKSTYPNDEYNNLILYLCKNEITEYENEYQPLFKTTFFKGKSYTIHYKNQVKDSGVSVEDNKLVFYKYGTRIHKNGVWKSYHENEKLKEIGEYENGLRVGLWKTYRKNGNLWKVGQYNSTNKATGKWKQYHNNGKIATVYEYNNNVGHKIESYDENGKSWKNKKTGKWKSYNQDGELYRSGEYLNGMEVGEWTWYYNDGQIDFTFFKRDNKKIGYKSYYPNGKIKTISVYKNDKEVEKKEFYKNGKLKFIEKHEEGKRDGEWKTYYENEQLTSIGNYKKDKKNGEWKFYFANGQINAIGKFVNGVPNAVWKEYYKNGQLKEIGTYKEGEKTGVWKYYNEEGKLIK